jgi:antitoxin component YwqK of YwqJK toxin-antitoxin module
MYGRLGSGTIFECERFALTHAQTTTMRLIIYAAFFFVCFTLQAQISFNEVIVNPKKYEFSTVFDSTYGIVGYNNLISAIAGDSVRLDQSGHKVQGWLEDRYTSGTTLHKGYYIDGKIRVFKNFYPDGKLERSFKLKDAKRSEMTIFFANEKVKSIIEYVGETITHQEDFYENGMKEYEEEFDKSGLILWKKVSYHKDGTSESSLEVIDKKRKKYLQQEFYEGGKLKCTGEMKLNMETYDFMKDGKWNYYDESGKLLKSETYSKGDLLNE